MDMGKVIFLNGASSSGKSTLIKELQAKLPDPYLEMGLDKFIWMLPKRYHNQPLWDDILGKADTAGALGHQLVHAMHRAIYALSHSGLNVLADHVLIEPNWTLDCARLFSDVEAYLVGVRCDLEILEKREKERLDRTLGQAKAQFWKVHAHKSYDFEVNTGRYSAKESVNQILGFLQSNTKPMAFKKFLSIKNST